MTTDEYLSQLRGIEEKIEMKFADAESCRHRAMKMRAMRIKEINVKTSPNLSDSEDAIVQALEDEEDMRRLTILLGKKKKYILNQIDNLNNHLHIVILRGYYLDDKTFNEISIDLSRSDKSVRANYKKAIKEFEDKYGENYLNKKPKYS